MRTAVVCIAVVIFGAMYPPPVCGYKIWKLDQEDLDFCEFIQYDVQVGKGWVGDTLVIFDNIK